MRKEELYKQYAGKYRLIKFVIGGGDVSEKYINGWKDKSFYMFFEITEDGQFTLKAHAGGKEKVYKYFLDPDLTPVCEERILEQADFGELYLPEYRRHGIASALTSRLAKE